MKKIETLILSGGGIKGIAIISALEILENNNYLTNVNRIVGSSIGALIALGIASNIKCNIIKQLLMKLDLSMLVDIDLNLFFEKFGFNNFDYLDKLLKLLMKEKNIDENITFKDFHEINKIELILVGTNLSENKPEYFSYNKTPNVKIIDAVKASAAYPIACTPINIEGNLYSDGGIVSPLPSDLVKKKDRDTTLGILIRSNHVEKKKIESFQDYIFSIMSAALDSLITWELKNLKHKIIIYSNVSAMNLSCSEDIKKELENSGIKYTNLFLKKNEIQKIQDEENHSDVLM